MTDPDCYCALAGLGFSCAASAGELCEAPLVAHAPAPTWNCEYCGRFFSERTAAAHGWCQQAQDRRDAESVWRDV